MRFNSQRRIGLDNLLNWALGRRYQYARSPMTENGPLSAYTT